MDPVRNPFAPGAGNRPPELAGRDSILEAARVAIERVLIGKAGRSQMFLGLRGVGKTVLLNTVENMAIDRGHLTSSIEAPEHKPLGEQLLPKIHQVLHKLSFTEKAKSKAYEALQALKSFAGSLKLTYGDMSIAVEPAKGIADSGDLEQDLPELFVRVGEAAQAAGVAWTLLIDEVQYLSQKDLAALIVSLHKVNQRQLPVLFFGAGLPQVAALAGDTKSYAERLFSYPEVGALPDNAAKAAIRQPVEDEGAKIDEAALDEILAKTRGYPYFLQEWGHQSWNVASENTITLQDTQQAEGSILTRLDQGFFKVRFDRLTPKEREYVFAMAKLGEGPYRSSDIAEALGESLRSLGPRRAQIISKGMIFSPSHGEVAFTVPFFNDYLVRNASKLEKFDEEE